MRGPLLALLSVAALGCASSPSAPATGADAALPPSAPSTLSRLEAPERMKLLDRVDFDRGFSFEESSIGTNGVGTVFEVGAPVSVVGSEHFNQSLVQFACTGAPILDPLTGRVVGVLDAPSLARCAQLAPGEEVRFRVHPRVR